MLQAMSPMEGLQLITQTLEALIPHKHDSIHV
jgi:hypothetical protein